MNRTVLKYCYHCQKLVNTTNVTAEVYIATITSYYCVICNSFINSDVKNNNELLGDNK